jgi:hypothetical protein
VSKDTILVIKLSMIELFEAPIIKFIVQIFNGTKWHVALKNILKSVITILQTKSYVKSQ